MNKKTVEELKKKIIKWVEENHCHHEFAGGSTISFEDLVKGKPFKKITKPKGICGCKDNDFPYVNSLDLVEFLNKTLNS